MKTVDAFQQVTKKPKTLNDLPALFFRLILAYGFYIPAMTKWATLVPLVAGSKVWEFLLQRPMPTFLRVPKWLL